MTQSVRQNCYQNNISQIELLASLYSELFYNGIQWPVPILLVCQYFRTHLYMYTHYCHGCRSFCQFWGKRDVTIPVSEIDKIADEAVYLKLDKKAIETLPTVPVRRKWK